MAGLCYVSAPWAWFTPRSLETQWGDDWDDAPYEHNAGRPYEEQRGHRVPLLRVAFDGPFMEPCHGHLNSPYSVRDINDGDTPWLKTFEWVKPSVDIWAGVSLDEFTELVERVDGTVWRPRRGS